MRAGSITPQLSITSFSRCLRFEINLLCDPGDQIALHFNPRFSSSRIVCNSFLANHWGKEEVNNTFPFEAKEPFQVTLCHPMGLLGWDRSDPANIGVLLMDLALPFLPAPYPVTAPLWLCLLLVFLLYCGLLLIYTQLGHRHAEPQQYSRDAAFVFSLGFALSPVSTTTKQRTKLVPPFPQRGGEQHVCWPWQDMKWVVDALDLGTH